MEQGNPNKIDAIVEEIVRNNSIFKLKSPIEQEKEKAVMAKGINSALSVLNEAGKELVLQDLSVDPDEKFKGFIDSVGNIDISGITQYTASIVKVKIEEAEREGINLRREAVNVTKDNQTISIEDTISMAVVSNMILNYENLSREQKNNLLSEKIYTNLSDKDRQELNRKVFAEARSKNLSENERKQVDAAEKHISLNEAYIKLLNENPKLTTFEEIFTEFKKKFPEFSEKEIREFCEKCHKEDVTVEDNVKARLEDSLKVMSEIDRISARHDYNYLVKSRKREEARAILEIYRGQDPEIDRLLDEMERGKFVEWDESKVEQWEEQGIDGYELVYEEIAKMASKMTETRYNPSEYGISIHKQKIELEEVCQIEFKVENLVQGEIEKLTDRLLGESISKDQIKESMEKYKELMKEIPLKYVSNLESLNSPEREEYLTKLLTKKCNISPEIAKHLSEMEFNGQLIDILKNEDRRAEFIEQLGQAIDQIKGPEVANEAPNQDVLDAQPIPEEVAAELQAIPVALQRINCQPEDIAKGMEAYKQVIEALTPEEVEGTPELITEVLQKASEELELDGNAADILKMMSQITFNGQISEILKNCKGEFLNSLETLSMQGPLLDPRVYAADFKQNNSNSANPNSLIEKVDEDSLRIGFDALAVDLQIADATIMRQEKLVTDENAQLENGQEENPEFSKKEDREENPEGVVMNKLQAFFGVYRNAGMIEVREVGEEIKEIVQELDLNLQNNNVHRVEEEIKNDEGIEQ